MSNNWIVENIQNALGTWNDKLNEIWRLLTESPESFKGGAVWNVMVNINGTLKAVGYPCLLKKGKRKTEVFLSSVYSFALHKPLAVASTMDSSLSSKLSSCASKRLRAELLLTSLLGNMYSSTEMLNIVIS